MNYNQRIMDRAGPLTSLPLGHSRRLSADLTLLLVAVIWGSAFVVQRVAALQVGVFLFNGLRFLLAALAMALLAWFVGRDRPVRWRLDRRSHLGVAAAGLLLFAGAAFQQAGLQYTTAGNAGFITGLYVVIIPLILAIVWRQPPPALTWLAAGLAVVGLYFLSTTGQMRLNPGDALEVVGALFWALHVILIGMLAQRLDIWQIAIGQYLVCGLISVLIGFAIESHTLPALAESWWVVAYTGLLSVGVGYTLQVAAQRHAPPADAAIILSGEAVFAALCGWLFLGERLAPVQLLGCGIMLAGVLLAQAPLLKRLQR
jgi:drug/metabolite transporter (DMT)-like permease